MIRDMAALHWRYYPHRGGGGFSVSASDRVSRLDIGWVVLSVRWSGRGRGVHVSRWALGEALKSLRSRA